MRSPRTIATAVMSGRTGSARPAGRGRVGPALGLALSITLPLAVLPTVVAAQMSEETVEVPTSAATRAESQSEIDARIAGEAAAAGAEGPSTAETAWRDVAAPYDLERIERNEEAYGQALRTAETAGSAADRAELRRVLADLPQPIDAAALPGAWNCRTIRFVTEPASFRVYDWFDCRITELSRGLLLEKLGGSELTSGYLYPDSETRMIFLGHAHDRAQPARDYSGTEGPEGDDPANPDDPGVLTQRGPDRLLLAKPFPVGTPDYDFLELRRR